MNNVIHCLRLSLATALFTLFALPFVVAQTPPYFKGIGTSSNAIPLNAANNATHCQQIYTPTDFNTIPPSGAITKVYMRNTAAGATGTYTNFSISFLQNSLTAFPNSTFLTGFTNALTASSITITGNAVAGEWFEIPLDVPFFYDNTQSLVYEIKYTGRTGGISTLNTSSTNKRLSIVAPPGPATGNLAATWMDFGIEISNPCAGAPVPGAATVSPQVACVTNPVRLALSGNIIQTNLTYVWQSSPTLSGPYTDISTPLPNPTFDITATSSLYYRAVVSCGAASDTSVPVLLTVAPPLAANTYTIDNTIATGALNFNSFTDAFNALTCGVTGKTIFNVRAGQTFFENPPALLGSGTVTDSIIFQRSSTGANPVIQPAVGGTVPSSTTLGAHGDAVIAINGGDYITFDGIDINTQGFSSGDEQFEYGYYLKKKSATDAGKNITIKNAVITLSKSIYSFGIHISNNSGNGAVTVTGTGGASENINISGNTIYNSFGGILVRGQGTEALYDQNISIGVDSGNTIYEYAGGASTAYGIYTTGVNNLKIANNALTSVSSGQTSTLYGIYTASTTNANTDIYNNTLTIHGGGTTSGTYVISNNAGGTGTNNLVRIFNNTITSCSYPSSSSGPLHLIEQSASAYNLEIYGNTITNNSINATTSATFHMIYQAGTVVNQAKIYNNIISGNNRTSGTTGVSYGIYNTGAATSNNQVYNNVIDNNSIISTTGSLTGIHMVTGLSNAVYNNKISGLTNTASTTGAVYGITIESGGLTNNVYNNFISDLNAPSSTTTGTSTTDLIRAINILSTTALSTQNISFNTILLNATGGSNFSTSGVYHTASTTATTSKLNLLNNIIVNTSTANGIGYASALRRSSAVLTNYGTESNNNLLYINNSSNQVLFYDGTNSDLDITSFKIRVAPRETATVTENINFVNGVAIPYDLHINPAIPTQAESGAIPVAGVVTDIDGNPRNPSTPDIGADEFTGIAADLSGPTITYAAIPKESICIENKIITATITDPSGVNVAPGTKPRLWFKKSTEADALPATNTSASNGWKYVMSDNNVSPFTFTFDFSLLNTPLTFGDSISYFIVAQDVAATPNVGVSVATFSNPPATVALSASSFPVSGNINGFLILNQPNPIAIKSNSTELCMSGTATLSVDGVNVTGGTYQWQSSPHGQNAFTDINGATTLPYTTGTLTDSTDFRLVIKCGGTPIPSSPSPVITVNVNKPQVVSTTAGYHCGPGPVTLQAIASDRATVNWYSASAGGLPVATGSPFVTPSINTTTTYYVSAGNGGGLTNVGLPVVTPNPTSGSGTTNFGLVFEALSDFTLQSVLIYPTSTNPGTTGTVTIDVINSAGTVINTAVVNVTANPTASQIGERVTLNFNIPAGTNYKLRHSARSTGIGGLLFGPSPSSTFNFGYPFVIPGVVSINHSTLTVHPGNTARLDLYYYFYDWEVVTGCESARVPVEATIDNSSGCVMPVTLMNFAGEKQGKQNKLWWSTATEINNSGFELQRSVDGINFSKMTFVASEAINGNSSAAINYSFNDVLPLKGSNYYRLKQMDKDGKSSLTKVVLIKGNKTNAIEVIAVYPNPVQNLINLVVEAPQVQKSTLLVTDVIGKVVMQQQATLHAGTNNIKLQANHLAPGSYFIKVSCPSGCQEAVQKFIKQ